MSRYVLDPKNPEYIPAPPIPQWFKEELSNLLAPNPFGEPQLRAAWGMDARAFRNENPDAIKYIALHHLIRTRKFRRLDPIAGRYEYFDKRDEAVNALNIRLAPTIEYKVEREVRIFGPPRWIIEQWYPPERIDSKKNWERNRMGEYTSRRGEHVRFDALGPYPTRGQYREHMMVEDAEGNFRDLDRGVITLLRAQIVARSLYNHNAYTDLQEIKDLRAAKAAEVAEEEKRIEDEFIDGHLGPSAYRLIEGNAFAGYAGTAAQQAAALKK